jgi:magnesium-transporting ATPase (P-type)
MPCLGSRHDHSISNVLSDHIHVGRNDSNLCCDSTRSTEDEIDALPTLPLVIARCAPNTKVRMIDALHRRGQAVMTIASATSLATISILAGMIPTCAAIARAVPGLTEDEIDALPTLPLVIARCAPNTKVRMIDALHRKPS